jgi:hypothetical protein
MKEHKRYIERSDLKGATHLEVSVYYDKGGMNYFTDQVSPRGYYLSVRPVTLGPHTVSFDMHSGCKRLILETKRYSDKQFNTAIEMAKAHEDDLIAKAAMKKAA